MCGIKKESETERGVDGERDREMREGDREEQQREAEGGNGKRWGERDREEKVSYSVYLLCW